MCVSHKDQIVPLDMTLTIVASTNIVIEIPSIVLCMGWPLGRPQVRTQHVIEKRTT